MIEFNMPSDIENEEIYKLEIIKIKETQETSIYTSHFRTSMHNTSQEKFKVVDDFNNRPENKTQLDVLMD